ncbi:MAG TPA: 3-deoxy-D-manno-octulosonic acid transferase [Planctomycetes bacterium]|nr:3-deoxy-D-manno-octulosonic acid transferase [Planctomycetota bacterium]
MRILIDFVYLLAALAYSPIIIYRAIRHKRYRTGWAQRFGKITRKDRALKKCIWLHAVSVGEVNAARTIIEELEIRFPDFEIVISTTTDTGFARANALFGENLHVFYFPFDLSWVMRRAFHKIRPAICLLMEQEVWPNFVHLAQQLEVPVVVVNGRISDKSFARYKKVKTIAKMIWQKVTLVLAQTDEYAQRFITIGAPAEKVIVTGSLKYDTAQTEDKVEGADALAAQLDISCHCEPEQSEGVAISKPTEEIASVAPLPRNDAIEGERLWVAGATGPGEEKIILDVFTNLTAQQQFNNLRLVIVPRKPERFDEVAQLIEDAGFDFVRYSTIKNTDAECPEKTPVILGDTMGDLRKFYSLATIIFVGRSLVPMGGSDMMEAAALGKCTLFGPHAFNFRQTVDALIEDEGAIMVKDEQELLQTMQKCLSEPDFAQKIARSGRQVIRKNQGATTKTIEQIAIFLKSA